MNICQQESIEGKHIAIPEDLHAKVKCLFLAFADWLKVEVHIITTFRRHRLPRAKKVFGEVIICIKFDKNFCEGDVITKSKDICMRESNN